MIKRALRLGVALILALACTASAATDIQILFDTDRLSTTGCIVAGWAGAERVVDATVETTPTPRITAITYRECVSGALGAPLPLAAAGAVSPSNAATGVTSVEMRIPTSFFGSAIQPSRIGFVLTDGSAMATVLQDEDGGPIIYPPFVPRRRSENQRQHAITIDGSIADWSGPALVSGGPDDGKPSLRLLNVFAVLGSEGIYFRFDLQSNPSAPTARNDVYSTAAETPLSVPAPGVLGNDSDPNGKALTANVVAGPAAGILVLNADGSFSFVPDGSGTGRQTFTYQATNGTQPSNVARVEIGVGTRPNRAPVAADDAYSVVAGETLTVAAPGVLKNDSDADHDPLTAHVTSQPAHGALTFQPDGSFTYSNDGTTGLDSFKYRANDGFEDSNEATVQLPVSPRPSQPFFTSASAATFYIGVPGSFRVTTEALPIATLTETGALPNGIVFSTPKHDGTATLSGIAAAGTAGTYVLTLQAANPFGTATQIFTLTVACPSLTVGNPAVAAATAGTPFSQTFTSAGGVGAVTFSTASALPAGLTLAANGVLSGTPVQTGTFPIVVTATDSNGCSGTGATYNLVVSCPTITLTKPSVGNATAGAAFSQTFTQSGGVGVTTFSTVSTLPAGLTLAANGVLAGTPTQTGTFDLVVVATDANNCTGSVNYTLVVGCQTIAVTNPAMSNGTASSPFSQSFTQSGAIGTATFSLASGTLPAGLALAANGTLSGSPTQTGSFSITVTATDANGCSGTGATYTLVIACQTITVTNPASGAGTANAAFSQTFTQSGGIGGATFSLASGTLPAGLTLAANGTLSGTPTQTGSFPVTVSATDSNGCTGTSATYTITIACQTIVVNNPATTTGTVSAAFSQTFTATNAVGTVAFTTASTLPAGLTLAANGTLSGTPTQTGTFPITVMATDQNGCSGVSAVYNLVIGCQTISVTNPASTAATAGSPFSETFTQTAAVGATTFTTASTLPAGLTLAANGTLSGTPTQTGTFPIVVTATDANGCSGTSAPYNLIVGCPTITVTNPATSNGTVNAAFSQTFASTGGIGAVTITTASVIPNGLTLAANGTLSGTPLQSGTFPIVVTATDVNGCTGTSATYTLVIACQTITVNNPATNSGTAGTAFTQSFTQTGGNAPLVFSLASGTLPAGLTLAADGTLSGTPTQTGSFPITVSVADGAGCSATGPTYNLVIGCQTITVTNPAITTGTAGVAFSQTFTQSSAIGTTTFTTASALPAGITLAPNGVLSGTPVVTGSFSIVVTVTDSNGCTGTGATYNLVIGCPTISVTNPANATGAVSAAFSEQFTQSSGVGTVAFTTGSTLPAGLTLATNGTLSGTPTQTGTFPIVVTATDSNGCTGTGATYNLVIGCQTISVTNPANTAGTVSSPFSEQFNQSGAVGGATFTTGSTLPAGLTLSTSGLLSGTPTQTGTFPIVVTVTDGNSCTGTAATYNLIVGCQTITVTNPATTSSPAGTPLSINFTQTGAVGGATFTTSSTLPAGLSLAADGTLSGTPGQGGTFPISVTVTDGNACSGTNSSYSLTIVCPVITVTNPATTTGTAGTPFNDTFTQSGGLGTVTFSTASPLPAGLTLAGNGTLSGTPTQTGTFGITVTATDQNGCTGTGSTYTLVIACPTITVTNPVVNSGTVDASFTQTFTQAGAVGTATFTTSSTLPAGLILSSSGVLSGTPTVTGAFPIDVLVTDSASCTGTNTTYTLTINCQTITVTNPAVTTATAGTPFSQSFTQTGAHASATFTTSSALPTGLTLAVDGTLSGTPTVIGTFPIDVTVTDANNCTGTNSTYTLVIGCPTIVITPPANATGTVNALYSETFTQSGAVGTATFSTGSTLPNGVTLSSGGVLSGTPTQAGSFSLLIEVKDANNCQASRAFTLTINCQTITVTNPTNAAATVASPFSEQFTQSGGFGTTTFSTTSTLPTGVTLDGTTGILSGTPTQAGTYPITVKATDSNGCFGTSAIYTLVVSCNAITVTNPATDTGTAGVAFSATFTQSGGNGAITWSVTGALPTGIAINTATGELSGTTNSAGTFPITVTATDVNSCAGTGAGYTLNIGCQSISITNPATTSVQAGQALSATFTASGILGTATWSVTAGTLPTGITLDSSTGVLSGSTTQQGTFPVTVRVTDSNGCSSNSSYTLTVTCPVITTARTGGGLFPAGTIGTAYAGESFAASGGTGPYTFAVTSGTFPPGLSLSSAGAISGTPTATGTFQFDVTATDAALCTGTASFAIAINPAANGDTYSNLVNNTEAVVTGGSTASPATPFVSLSGVLIANDLPAGGVAVNAGTFSTAQSGSVTIAADGSFKYTPPVTAAALTTDSFNYTITSNSGGTATPTQATGAATLNLSGRVWYVKNDGPNGNGQSQSPFNTMASFTNGGRSTPDKPGDIIFVYTGDGTTTNLNAGPPAYSLLDNEQLIGQGFNAGGSGFALVVNGNNLVATGAKPKLTNSAGDVVLLASNNSVKGLELSGATGSGIRGQSTSGFAGDTLDLLNNAAAGLNLDTMAGTIVLTNSTISGNQQYGLKINGGAAAVSVDATNSISAVTTGAGVYSVAITGHATGLIDIGATINDTGRGISISGNTSGTIQFTGNQTLSIPSNFNAVDLSSNTGATITFSGTLNATATSGASFSATGGGTLNVSGTANLAKAGGGNNVLIMNGMTIGGSGVTFATVNTSGFSPSVPVSLTNVNGTVTINGGTIGGNGLTGIALQGSSTSLTLANVTINGTLTNGIKTTTNFGTLTIGSNVSVSAANALDLNTGTVTGTFTSVTATGGSAPGVNLNGVTVTTGFGTAGGSVNGGNDTAFKVTGGSGAAISWGGTINQSLGFGVVSLATNANTITFSGNVTGFNASTGIAITSSTGTYTFSGAANNITGTGAASFTVSGGTATVTYNGNATQGAAFPLVSVTDHSTGVITFQSGTLTGNSSNTGLVFTNADGTYNFNGTTTLSGASTGVDVLPGTDATNGSQGTFSFASGASITGPNGPVIDIQASKPAFTYSGSFSKSTAGVGFNAQNNQGGSITINGTGTKSLTTSTGNAVFLDNNDNCTIAFSGNNLVLTTTTGAAFTGTNGGTITVTGTGNTISTTSGAAVNVANTTIGGGGITFQSVAHNGNNTAITLNTTGAGAFTVTGTGTTAGSGGTIQNIVGSDAVVLNTTGGLVTLKNMVIQDITASTDATDLNDTRSNVDAIQGQIVNGGLTLNNVTIQRISDDGINGTVNGAPPSATVWNGLTLTNCTFTNTNRFNTTHADANNEGAVFILGIKGTISVTGSTFSNAGNGLILWTDTSGTLDATIQSNSFTTLYKEIGTSSIGNFGIDIVQQGSLSSTVRIGDTAGESNPALGNTFTNGGDRASVRVISNTLSTGAMRSSIAKNTFTVTDHSSPGVPAGSFTYNFPQGGVLLRAMGTGNYEGIFAANVLTQLMHADGGLGQLTILAEKGDSEFIVRNNQFNLPWDAPIELRADGAAGGQNSARVLFTGNTYQDGIVGDGTTDVGGQSPYEGFYAQVRNNGRMDLTIQNEGPLGLTDNTSALGTFSFYARTTTAGDVLNLFLQNTLSPRGFQLNAAAGTTYNLFRNGSVSGTAQGVLQDNLNKGGGGVDTTVPPTVSTPGAGTVSLVGSAPVLPVIAQP